jgi:hypothetical protein
MYVVFAADKTMEEFVGQTQVEVVWYAAEIIYQQSQALSGQRPDLKFGDQNKAGPGTYNEKAEITKNASVYVEETDQNILSINMGSNTFCQIQERAYGGKGATHRLL